jgi:hypothetical protein
MTLVIKELILLRWVVVACQLTFGLSREWQVAGTIHDAQMEPSKQESGGRPVDGTVVSGGCSFPTGGKSKQESESETVLAATRDLIPTYSNDQRRYASPIIIFRQK